MILSIVKEWLRLHKEILAFEDKQNSQYGNVRSAANAIGALRVFFISQRPYVDEWMRTMLSTRRAELWVRYWLHYGSETFHRHLQDAKPIARWRPEFHAEWERVPMILDGMETSIAAAESALDDFIRRRDPSHCDQEEILALHKDKACESNGWFCWYCEDVEHEWEDYLRRQITGAKNVFFNKTLHDRFLDAVLPRLWVRPTWEPPRTFEHVYRRPPAFLTGEERVAAIEAARDTYARDGKTPMQCMKEVLVHVKYDEEWRLDYSIRTEFDAFRFFWGRLPLIQHTLDADWARCEVIQGYL